MYKFVALVAACVAVQSSAQAADLSRVPAETFVSTHGVNFADPADVRALYGKLTRAAVETCDSQEPRMLAVSVSDKLCARAALDRAVAKINQPMLSAYHMGAPANAQLAQR